MRIIFEFRGKDPQVSGTGHHYHPGPITEPPRWRGFHAELVMVDASQPHGLEDFKEGDAVYLEGHGESLRSALKDALELIDSIEQLAKESFAREVACIRQCPRCSAWVTHDAAGQPNAHHNVFLEDQPVCR